MSVALAKVESWEDHVEAWHFLNRQVADAAWSKAALVVSVRERFDKGSKTDAIKKFAEDIRCHWGSLYRLARAFDAFPDDLHRCKSLTFTHHLVAVELTDSALEAREAAAHAEREGWSAGALRVYLKPPALPVEACDTEEGACGPVTPKDRMLHLSLLIGGFNKVREYELEPLAQLGTKKSIRELSGQIGEIITWLESFKTAIKRRI